MAEEVFDQARREGYPSVYVLHVHGIPYLFAELEPRRATSPLPPELPAGFVGVCGALYLDERAAWSAELDRETGIARGDAVNLTLSWEALEAADLTSVIFTRPSRRARLSASVGPTDTTLVLDDNAGWVGGDLAYLGRECVRVGGTSGATQLTGCTRGIVGRADRYTTSAPSSFADVTDRPQIWRGRRVTLYEHLLSPEGRFLQTAWLETGALTRVAWHGYIDDEPRPTAAGMSLRALPLQRLAAEEIGYEIAMEVIRPTIDFSSWVAHPIVASPGSSLTLRGRYTGPSSGSWEVTIGTYTTETPTTIGQWMSSLSFELDSALTSQPWYTAGATLNWYNIGSRTLAEDVPFLSVLIPYDSGYTMTAIACVILPLPQLYWLRPGVFEGVPAMAGNALVMHFENKVQLSLSTAPGAWLLVSQTEGEAWQDLAIPSSGAAVLEDADRTELIRWDRSVTASWVDPRWVLLHVIERGAGGTSIVNLDALERIELKFVTGHLGTAAEVLLTLLQSSGAGNRGAYDTLGLGLGCGIEEDVIDVAAFLADPDLAVLPIAAFAAGRTSLEDLIGGWLALHGKCLAMRPVVVGGVDTCKLTIVQTLPLVFGPRTPSLVRADVELEGVDYPEAITPPNEVRVSLDSIRGDGAAVIVQDRVAIQASGPRTFETSAPGMSTTLALQLSANLIAAGLGQSLWSCMVSPGVRLWVGDVCVLRVGHPGQYDWGTGRRAPPAIAAVVVGDQVQAWDGRRRLIFLQAGVLAEGVYLAPSIPLTYVDEESFEIDYGPIDLLALAGAGQSVRLRLYNRGEPSENTTVEAELVDEVIGSVPAGLPAWVTVGTIVTMGDLGTGDASLEALYLFQSSARRWSP